MMSTDDNPLVDSGESRRNRGATLPIVCLLALTALYVIFAAASWRRMNHFLVDCGRELYVPWRMVERDVLYRDLAYFNGPLSPMFNAFVFQVGGVSTQSLLVVNLIIGLAILWLLVLVMLRFAGVWVAAVGGFAFIAMFAFNHYLGAGIFSYVLPYSHEMTHGFGLSLLGLFMLDRPTEPVARRTHRTRVLTSGILGGLVFLTKPEIFLDYALAVLAWWLARIVSEGKPNLAARWRQELPLIGLQMLALILVVAVAALVIVYEHGDVRAWHHVLGGWQWIGNRQLASQPFYRNLLGTDQLVSKLTEQGRQFLALMALAGAALGIDRAIRVAQLRWQTLLVSSLGLAWAIAITFRGANSRLLLFQGFSAMTLVAVGGCLWRIVIAWRQGTAARADLDGLPWAVLALVLLAKIFFSPFHFQYGFVLALPAAMVVLVNLSSGVYRLAQERWGGGGVALALILAAAIFDAAATGTFNLMSIRRNTYPIGFGDDRLLIPSPEQTPATAIVEQAIEVVAKELDHDETLVVLPEGILINYLARKKSSVKYTNFMPIEMVMYGEEVILRDLQRSPPDYVLLVDRNTAEYGDQFGSSTYGGTILSWLEKHYFEHKTFGQPMDRGGSFGIKMLKRKATGVR